MEMLINNCETVIGDYTYKKGEYGIQGIYKLKRNNGQKIYKDNRRIARKIYESWEKKELIELSNSTEIIGENILYVCILNISNDKNKLENIVANTIFDFRIYFFLQ